MGGLRSLRRGLGSEYQGQIRGREGVAAVIDDVDEPETIRGIVAARRRKRRSPIFGWFIGAAMVALFIGLLAAVATAQTYMLDSEPDMPLLSGGGESLEVRLHNGGLPDNWGLSKTPSRTWGWTPGEPITFKSWSVKAPGYTSLYGWHYGCREVSPGYFVLAAPYDWKVPAKRNNIEIWPGTNEYHRVFPGDTLYARFVPADDPWELRYLAKITPKQRTAALKIMAFDEARIAKWPWLAKIVNLYRYDVSSLNLNAAPGQRNAGWLLIPQNFAKRWWVSDLSSIQHWYGLGSRSAVGGENQTNEHYGSDAAWIGRGLRDDDPVALDIGLYLLRHKIAYGLIDCDNTTNWMWGKWRNEKGDVARGTTGMAPSPAKSYDKSLAMGSVILPEEPMIKRAAAIRKAHLLTWSDHAWTGSGGLRNLGHHLENLRHWYVATNDARFQSRAASEITFALGVIGSTIPYIPENRATGMAMAGEGVCALAAMRWWADHGAATAAQKARLDALLAWHVANGIGADGLTPYELYVKADGTVTPKYSGTFQGCNWLQVPGLPPDVAAKVEHRMFTKYAASTDCDAAFGGEGPGWEKWLPWIVNWGACNL